MTGMQEKYLLQMTRPMPPQTFAEKLGAVFFPPRCIYCGDTLNRRAVCPACGAVLRTLQLSETDLQGRTNATWMPHVLAAWQYTGIVRKAMLLTKYHDETWRTREFSRQMCVAAQAADLPKPDLVLPVPDSEATRMRRNASVPQLLAQDIGRCMGAAVPPGLLCKRFDTPAQHTLTRGHRRANPVGAYTVTDPAAARDKTIWLVDDIITTGATLDTCARLLWLYGAKQVVGLCYGCTPSAKERKENGHGVEQHRH